MSEGPPRQDHTLIYPQVPASPSLPEIEEKILATWAADNTFGISVSARPGSEAGGDEYVFYDGPPFANGLPHYGHLLTGYVKDAVPRYRTMRGQRVERRFGWDCHGLPAEIDAQKQLGVSGRGPITAYGVDRFNDACRSSVLRYTHEWERYVTRMARWVDFEDDYKTMDLSYMESVMWAVKQLWEKGLLYEGYRVSPYCWECETVLANFETRLDNSYRDRQDPAVTVSFTVDPSRSVQPGAADPGTAGSPLPADDELELWVWTTTPWTLPSNLALSVGPDLDYDLWELGGKKIVVGSDVAANYSEELEDARLVGTIRGSELVGRTYQPIFGYFADHPGAFRVLAGDFVSTDEGTGIVHMAPGFGEDDQRVCEAAGIAVVCPVDDRARFTSEIPDFEGMLVFDANTPITRVLRERGIVVRSGSYVHSYPHCWRTDTPLIYRAVSSWFVKVTAIKERMLELNQEITWVPGHVKDGAFGKWLEGARDWPISRNRFWGSPVPIWKSDNPEYPRVDVYGSLDEIEADFGLFPKDLHRPHVDELTRPNPDDPTGASTMRRVTDVLDCWFESGSMPFAQVHYPFEHRQWFDEHFPADFIVEYIGQTRGWFYTLHVLATALFDRHPFKVCMAHGIVLGDDGQKMSKRLSNYPDPEEMFAVYGADAMRWFLLSSPVLRGGDMIADERGIRDAVRQAIRPLWNTWHFLSLYANAEGRRARTGSTSAPGLLDRYLLAKTSELVTKVTAAMDAYDLSGTTEAIHSFLDAMTNWYIRRSRDRFWGTSPTGSPGARADAFDTLATALEVLCRVAAPVLPLVTEEVWTGLTGGRSVHLQDWPDPAWLPADRNLVATMDRVRELCSAAHSVRKANGLRARLPLASLTFAAPNAGDLADLAELIAEELNVKEVRLTDEVDDFADQVLAVNFKVAAPRLGALTRSIGPATKRGDWELLDGGRARVGEAILEASEFELKLKPRNDVTSRAMPDNLGVVVLDLASTTELETEGTARDLVRAIQELRRELDLQVTDRIAVTVSGPPGVLWAISAHHGYIAEQVLASSLVTTDAPPSESVPVELWDGTICLIEIRLAG
jgi:isoleucyl-tRNA synthetase